jgi:hypothetical protein
MTIAERQQTAPPAEVPSYVAIRPPTVELIGIGPDSALVVDNWLWLSGYVHHLTHPLFALVTARNVGSVLALTSYSEVQRQLAGLRIAPEADEFGRIRPSDSAIAAATRVTFSIVQVGLEMPMVEDVSTDSDGAIRILWTIGGRKLELVCPFQPSQRPYWYYSDAQDFRIEYEQSRDVLRRLVAWLNGKTTAFPR